MQRIIHTIAACLFVILGTPQRSAGQHCPFDLSAIVVLHIHAEGNDQTIPGLKVSLLDSNGQVKDQFWQNALASTSHGYIDNEHPARVRQIRFPFALDHYVWVCSNRFPLEHYQVRIESTEPGNKNGYEARVLSLSANNLFSLCGTYDEATYPTWMEREGVPYRPLEVVLKKKEY